MIVKRHLRSFFAFSEYNEIRRIKIIQKTYSIDINLYFFEKSIALLCKTVYNLIVARRKLLSLNEHMNFLSENTIVKCIKYQ